MERILKSKGNNGQVAQNCPTCASPNTKFCYYNNYRLSKPRYFCKACRRYWTKASSLRNIPVADGTRSKSSISSSSSSSLLSAPNFTLNPFGRYPWAANTSPEIDLTAVLAKILNTSSASETNDNSSTAMVVRNIVERDEVEVKVEVEAVGADSGDKK